MNLGALSDKIANNSFFPPFRTKNSAIRGNSEARLFHRGKPTVVFRAQERSDFSRKLTSRMNDGLLSAGSCERTVQSRLLFTLSNRNIVKSSTTLRGRSERICPKYKAATNLV